MDGNQLENKYQRQVMLPDIGRAGQARLARAHIAIVGCGALGSVAADLLARAGAGLRAMGGELRLIDRDVVEWSNLHRQVLYTAADAETGVPKAVAAAEAIARINPDVNAVPLVADADARSISDLLGGRPDVILDGTDSFETRFLLNDYAVREVIPFVYTAAVGTRAMLTAILPAPAPNDPDPAWAPGPCLRCLIDPPPPGTTETCDTAGILGMVSAAIASLQAVEALKIVLGRYDLVVRHVFEIDPWQGDLRRLAMGEGGQSPECPCCGQRRFEFLEAPRSSSTVLCGSDSVQVSPATSIRQPLDLPALAERLRASGDFVVTPHLLKGELRGELADVGSACVRLSVFVDGRAIVHGTRRPDRARALYARFVGA